MFLSADTRGRIAPCGCRERQVGGLARRATVVLEARRQAPVAPLVFEAGSLAGGGSALDALLLRYLLQGLALLNADAANLGRREVALGRAALREAQANSLVPLVSANVLDADSGEPLARDRLVLERAHPDGRRLRVGVTGVVRDDVPPGEIGEGLRLGDALLAAQRVLPALRRECDLVVLLADAPPAQLTLLARECPEATLVLGGEVAQPLPEAWRAGQAWLAALGGEGRCLGRLDLEPGAPGAPPAVRWSLVELTAEIPEDEACARTLADFRAAARRLNLEGCGSGGLEVLGGGPAGGYTGSRDCGSCHAEDYRVWLAQRHAAARETLVGAQAAEDPRCLRCHVVGYGRPEGYRPERADAADLGAVGCEDCHGPGARHAARERGEALARSAGLRRPGPAFCASCHDGENTPDFAFERSWPKIRHGVRLPPGSGRNRQGENRG